MVWLGIDYVKAVRGLRQQDIPRPCQGHGDREAPHWVVSASTGRHSASPNGFGHGWWRARTPGWGEVNWPAFITALIEVGYQGNIDIEHEDDVFAAAEFGKVKTEGDIVANYRTERKGLQLGYNHLSALIA